MKIIVNANKNIEGLTDDEKKAQISIVDLPLSPVPSSSSLATLALFLKSFLFCWSIALLAWVASSEAQFPMGIDDDFHLFQ